MDLKDVPATDFRRATLGFPDTLRDLCAKNENADILEVGAGRRPLFAPGEWPESVSTYTLNDISQKELDLAPEGYEKACFDICERVEHLEGSFDIIFSRFLAEHVTDAEKFHSNILRMLKPGGTAFHLMPTLYATPFVINWIIPESLTSRIVYFLLPNRRSTEYKFPAYYHWCAGRSSSIESKIRSVGYGHVDVKRFYGHYYYRRLPVIRSMEFAVRNTLCKLDWTVFGTYAYIIGTR